MTRKFHIADTIIDDASECYVIAEIGHNHMGSVETCKQMFGIAKEKGASAVKIQKRDNQKLFTRAMFNQVYDNPESYGKTYGEHREYLEFDDVQFTELKEYADEIGIHFFSTAFDLSSADFLANLDLPCFKVASGDLTSLPLLKYLAEFQKPMIISTGGAKLDDVRRAVETIAPINHNFAILQCTSGYPAAYEELNLRVIQTYRNEFPDNVIGWSGHDNGIAMSLVAYVLGARIIEKHFTLNRANKGTDHKFSLEPVGLGKMIRDLQRTTVALGDGVKVPYQSEIGPMRKMRKQLVAAFDLTSGTVLASEHIAMKSPFVEGSLNPQEYDNLLGRTLKVDLAEDSSFSYDMLD